MLLCWCVLININLINWCEQWSLSDLCDISGTTPALQSSHCWPRDCVSWFPPVLPSSHVTTCSSAPPSVGSHGHQICVGSCQWRSWSHGYQHYYLNCIKPFIASHFTPHQSQQLETANDGKPAGKHLIQTEFVLDNPSGAMPSNQCVHISGSWDKSRIVVQNDE